MFEGLLFAAFMVASLVFFRALFIQRANKAMGNHKRLREKASSDQKKRSSRKSVGFRRRAK